MNSAQLLGETPLDKAPTLAQAAAALAASHHDTDDQHPALATPQQPNAKAVLDPVDHTEVAATDPADGWLTKLPELKPELKAIEKLEKEVVNGENADLQEIKGLAKKLD